MASHQAEVHNVSMATKGGDLQRWRDLIVLLVQRDLRVRYRGSILGYVWSMMNPLLMMAILGFVFSHLLKFKIDHFPMFLLSGILTWNVFHQGTVLGTNSILQNGTLLKKVSVPAAIFPAASASSVVVNFALAILPYIAVAYFTGMPLTWHMFLLPIVVLPLFLFTYGAGLALASLNVRFRDVSHVLEPVMTMGFYATPIVYPVSVLPEKYAQLLGLNPMSHFVTAMRDVMYRGQLPSLQTTFIVCGLAAGAMILGALLYRNQRDKFIYFI